MNLESWKMKRKEVDKMRWYISLLFGLLLIWFGLSIGLLFFIPARSVYEEIGRLKEQRSQLVQENTKLKLETSKLNRRGGER